MADLQVSGSVKIEPLARYSHQTDEKLNEFMRSVALLHGAVTNSTVVTGGNTDVFHLVSLTPTNVDHKLGRVPEGVLVVYQSAHGSVRTVAWDELTVSVEASADMDVKLRVF